MAALGYERVRFLEGGLEAWLTDIIEPVLAPDATPAARSAFDRQAELARYFGGMPRVGVREESVESDKAGVSAVSAALRRARRRGCAF